MTDANTNVSLEALEGAIEAAIKAQFPTIGTVEFYREERRPVVAPAVLLEMSEFEPHKASFDAGTGQLVVDATFEARLLLPFKVPRVKQEIRKLAASFAAWIHLRRWPGIPNGECQFMSAYPDGFSVEQDQYEAWRVTWEQKIFLGDTVWTAPDWGPTTVWLQERIDGEKDGDEKYLGTLET